MWKVNHCEGVVSMRDILPMEMLEWSRLVEQRSKIEHALHSCLFTASHMDAWRRGLTLEQLKDVYT